MENVTTKQRTSTLKVLCLLSFMATGIYIIAALVSITLSFLGQPISDNDAEQAQGFLAYLQGTRSESIKDLVVQSLALTGLICLYQLKRIGFYLYSLAELYVYFEFTYAMFGNQIPSDAVSSAAFEMLWPLPFDLLFIALYWYQVKRFSTQVT